MNDHELLCHALWSIKMHKEDIKQLEAEIERLKAENETLRSRDADNAR